MDLLTGEFNNTLDDKGRVSLPARLRAGLPGILILTQGIDDCVWLFTPDRWRDLSRKLMESTSPFQAKSRMIQRRIIAPAQEVEVDKAGRIAIPQSLREFAGLSKDCVFLGIDKYFEIWDTGRYRSYWNEKKEEDFKEASEEISIFL